MGKVYKGDYGVQIKVKTGIDLTGAQTKVFAVSKPDGRKAQWTASIPTDYQPTEGILSYTTAPGDLDIAGNYKLQAVVTFPAPNAASLKGETAIFKIFDEGQ